MDHEHVTQQPFSRRAFLAGTGGFLAGAALGSRLLGAVGLAAPAQAEPPAWPWPYTPVDVDVARRKGYDLFWKGACCYGVAEAIVSQLREKVGHPYTGFTTDFFRYGEGGITGWGTVCGALNGAAAIISLVTADDRASLTDELFGWYCNTPIPTPQTQPFGPPVGESTSGSPLCHISLSRWAEASGHAIGSKEHYERCAMLTGDVAARTAELLNEWHAGTFIPAYTAPKTVTTCMNCHGPAGELKDAFGKMDCVQCHEPH